MTGDDMFRLFQANANGMEEFARLAGESSQARTRVVVAEVAQQALPPDEAIAIEMPVMRRVAVIEPVSESKRPWWERVGLVQTSKKSRRRLVRPSADPSTRATGT